MSNKSDTHQRTTAQKKNERRKRRTETRLKHFHNPRTPAKRQHQTIDTNATGSPGATAGDFSRIFPGAPARPTPPLNRLLLISVYWKMGEFTSASRVVHGPGCRTPSNSPLPRPRGAFISRPRSVPVPDSPAPMLSVVIYLSKINRSYCCRPIGLMRWAIVFGFFVDSALVEPFDG